VKSLAGFEPMIKSGILFYAGSPTVSISSSRPGVVIASASRTEATGFEFRQGVRFLGLYLYTLQCCFKRLKRHYCHFVKLRKKFFVLEKKIKKNHFRLSHLHMKHPCSSSFAVEIVWKASPSSCLVLHQRDQKWFVKRPKM
jgi:hypothetical protein